MGGSSPVTSHTDKSSPGGNSDTNIGDVNQAARLTGFVNNRQFAQLTVDQVRYGVGQTRT